MSKPSFSQIEVQAFWKIATDARRARRARDARSALDELEAMAMHTENPVLRARCVAVLDRQQAAA